MEIPSKIYISLKSAEAIRENGHSFSYVSDKPEGYKSGAVEYTNLQEKWHDANVDTPLLNKLSPDNPVIIYSKALHGNGIVCLNHTAFSMAFNFAILRDNSVIWAWLKDLLP